MTADGPVEDRRAAIQQQLERELRRIVDSGQYAAWFAKMANFVRYSPTNSAWIAAQAPHATRVASYRTWVELGRHVRKGESGICVLYPKPYWVEKDTGEKVRPPRTEADRVRAERRVSFRIGHVFDVTQTDGQALPELGRPAPAQAPQALVDHLEQWCADQGVTVETRQLPAGLHGYYQRDTDRIVLAATASHGERAATLAHELAHRHDPELLQATQTGDRRYYTHNRADCEAVAEGTAHVISARYGFDITGSAAGYIASWVDGHVERLSALHQRIGQVARTLLPPDRLDLALEAAASRAANQPAQRRARQARR